MTALVIASQKPQCVGVVNLEGPKVKDTLDGEIATIDVIAKEEIPCLGRVTSNLEQLHQIVVLAVDITANGDGRIHLKEVGLCSQKFRTLLDNPYRLLLGESALAVEVLLEKVDVGLFLGIIFKKLLIGRLEHGRRLDICKQGGAIRVSGVVVEELWDFDVGKQPPLSTNNGGVVESAELDKARGSNQTYLCILARAC